MDQIASVLRGPSNTASDTRRDCTNTQTHTGTPAAAVQPPAGLLARRRVPCCVGRHRCGAPVNQTRQLHVRDVPRRPLECWGTVIIIIVIVISVGSPWAPRERHDFRPSRVRVNVRHNTDERQDWRGGVRRVRWPRGSAVRAVPRGVVLRPQVPARGVGRAQVSVRGGGGGARLRERANGRGRWWRDRCCCTA
jgi:hypothetical protein